jgi:hypothetical protein
MMCSFWLLSMIECVVFGVLELFFVRLSQPSLQKMEQMEKRIAAKGLIKILDV